MAGVIVNNYGSFPVVFSSAKECTLTDKDGKDYIDFLSGIGVNCLGHAHPALVKAVSEQAQKQIHISNYYNSDVGLAYAEKLLAATGFDRVFFGNSGAEANEAAIKLARKYGWMESTAKDPAAKPRNVIVTLEKSFHGRTIATLCATGQDKFHPDCFAPYPAGFKTIKANDYEALKTAFDDSVCALMFECVQGEGGVNLVDSDWAKAAAEAARKAGAIVIADEVQTGMGRTGTLLASEQLGFEPEVVTLAKGIAGGIPMGACIFRGKAKDVFAAGDHQSTFAGNPLATAAATAVLDEFAKPGFYENVVKKGDYIRNTVRSWNLPYVKDVRGKGLMVGIDVAGEPGISGKIQRACLDHAPKGLCISTAGANTLRFLPPLVISMQDIDSGLEIIRQVLAETFA